MSTTSSVIITVASAAALSVLMPVKAWAQQSHSNSDLKRSVIAQAEDGLSKQEREALNKLATDPRISEGQDGSWEVIREVAGEMNSEGLTSQELNDALEEARIEAAKHGLVLEIGAVPDNGKTAFPGDLFNESDQTAFPGDLFSGDDHAFPGDLFDLARAFKTQTDWLVERAESGKSLRAVFDIESRYRADLVLLGEKVSQAAFASKDKAPKLAKEYGDIARTIRSGMMTPVSEKDLKAQAVWVRKVSKATNRLMSLQSLSKP